MKKFMKLVALTSTFVLGAGASLACAVAHINRIKSIADEVTTKGKVIRYGKNLLRMIAAGFCICTIKNHLDCIEAVTDDYLEIKEDDYDFE